MIYSHEKSFGDLLVFDHSGVELCILKHNIETDDVRGVVGFCFIGKEARPIMHDSPEFTLARLIWRES